MYECGFVILFGFVFMFFPCNGEISPSSGENITFLPDGKIKKIQWTLGSASSGIRNWFFTRRGSSTQEPLGGISGGTTITVINSSLPDVDIELPATLILNNVDERYNGKYEFEITVVGGRAKSYVNVYIAAKPNVIFLCPNTTTLNEGDVFRCVCKGEGGNPPADVTWFKDDKKIGGTGKGEQLLTFSKVDESDGGTYKCVAESYPHKDYKDNDSIAIIVFFKPRTPMMTIISDPPLIGGSAKLGGAVSISCSSKGFPEPDYTITHNGTMVSSTKTYNISQVKWNDTGTYKCSVRNFRGNDSVTKFLTVKAKEQTISTPPPTNPSTSTTNSTGNIKVKTGGGGGNNGIGVGGIVGIVIAVLVLILIIAGVVYYFCFKSDEKDGYRGKRDVSPVGRNDNNQYEMGDNAYDSVNPADGGEGSGEKSKKKNQPPVYAQVDKENRQGKPLYATLDTVALDSGGSKKRDEGRAQPTEYAAIDHSRTGDVPRADLV